jgi:hypothetical protein
MKARRNVLLLCGLVIALISVAAFTIKKTGLGAQEPPDPKAAIRHERREARYNVEPYLYWKKTNGIPWSMRRDGDFNVAHYHYGETEDINDPAVLSRMREKDFTERQKQICDADVIVKGEVTKAQGVITDDDQFIYTVYTFTVAEVMRAKPEISLTRESTIQFTAPGGTAIVGGKKKVTFNYPVFDPLKVGTQYLLYLARDEQADDYYVRNWEGVFQLDGDKLTRMDALMEPFFRTRARYLEAPATSLAGTNAVISADCGK